MKTKTKPQKSETTEKHETREVVSPLSSSRAFLTFDIESTAPLLLNRKDPVTVWEIDQARNKIPFVPRNLTMEQKFLECIHIIGERPKNMEDLKRAQFAIPAIAIKKALVRAAGLLEKKMTEARCVLHVIPDNGELIKLITFPPTRRIDGVTNHKNEMVARAVAEFNKWKATVRVRYLHSKLSADEVIAMMDTAGEFVGIGVSRPGGDKSTGVCGTFKINNVTNQ